MLTIFRHLKRGIALQASKTACTSDREGVVDAEKNGRPHKKRIYLFRGAIGILAY